MNLRLNHPAAASKSLGSGNCLFDRETSHAVGNGNLMGSKKFLGLVLVQFQFGGNLSLQLFLETISAIGVCWESLEKAHQLILYDLLWHICVNRRLLDYSTRSFPAIGRVGSVIQSLHEPTYSFEPDNPQCSIASRLWHAVTPDPHV